MAKIRKQYNQLPHLNQDTTWESNKNTINVTNKSQEVSPYPAIDQKSAMNRRESMRNTRHKKHKRSTKEVPPWNGQLKYLMEGLNLFHNPLYRKFTSNKICFYIFCCKLHLAITYFLISTTEQFSHPFISHCT